MKRNIYFSIFCGLVLLGGLNACSSDEDAPQEPSVIINPGKYVVGFNLDAEPDLLETRKRGLTSSGVFDASYDPDVIYLHKKNGDTGLEIPVYNYHCAGVTKCKGFRIELTKNEDGTFVVAPIAENGEVLGGVTYTSTDSVYFSSLSSRYWEGGPKLVKNEDSYLYGKSEKNVEIYRSKTNYSLDELGVIGGDMTLTRKCLGFGSFGVIIDQDTPFGTGTILSEDKFVKVMGDSCDNWYIKIVAGPCFTGHYDMQEGVTVDKDHYGFYATNNNEYVQARSNLIVASNLGGTSHVGIGYQTNSQDILITPFDITSTSPNLPDGRNRLAVYVYVKHWMGEGEPTADWLKSDENALYVVYRYDGAEAGLMNNATYSIGVGVNIHDLHNAFATAGLLTSADSKRLKRGMGRSPQEMKIEPAFIVFE